MNECIAHIAECYDQFGGLTFMPLFVFLLVGIGAQWLLYEKCGLRGIDCLIPIQNVITFLKIVGRPAIQAWLVILPPPILISIALFAPEYDIWMWSMTTILSLPWIYFMSKVYIEICNCFGRKSLKDYFLVIVFNGFYVLHLGLDEEAVYQGPIYSEQNAA